MVAEKTIVEELKFFSEIDIFSVKIEILVRLLNFCSGVG